MSDLLKLQALSCCLQNKKKKTLSGYTGVCNLGLWHPIKFEIRKTSELTEGILSCLTWTTCLFCGEIQYNHEGARTQMGHCNWWRVWTETKAEGSSLSRWGAELGCRSHRLARLLLRITTLSLKRSAIELSLMADFLNSLKYTHTHTCTHTLLTITGYHPEVLNFLSVSILIVSF